MTSRRNFISAAAAFSLVPFQQGSYNLSMKDVVDVLVHYPVYHVKELYDSGGRKLRGNTLHEDENGMNSIFIADNYPVGDRRAAVVHELTHAGAKMSGMDLPEDMIRAYARDFTTRLYNGSVSDAVPFGRSNISIRDFIDMLSEFNVVHEQNFINENETSATAGLFCARTKNIYVVTSVPLAVKRRIVLHETMHWIEKNLGASFLENDIHKWAGEVRDKLYR